MAALVPPTDTNMIRSTQTLGPRTGDVYYVTEVWTNRGWERTEYRARVSHAPSPHRPIVSIAARGFIPAPSLSYFPKAVVPRLDRTLGAPTLLEELRMRAFARRRPPARAARARPPTQALLESWPSRLKSFKR